MASRAAVALLFVLSLAQGCSHPAPSQTASVTRPPTGPPQVLAVYEAWFGHPKHISISYSSHDPDVIRKQIRQAKAWLILFHRRSPRRVVTAHTHGVGCTLSAAITARLALGHGLRQRPMERLSDE